MGFKGGSESTKAGMGVAVGLRCLSPNEQLPLLLWRLKNTWFLSAQTCWAGLYLSRCLSLENLHNVNNLMCSAGSVSFRHLAGCTWGLPLLECGTCHTHPGAPLPSFHRLLSFQRDP